MDKQNEVTGQSNEANEGGGEERVLRPLPPPPVKVVRQEEDGGEGGAAPGVEERVVPQGSTPAQPGQPTHPQHQHQPHGVPRGQRGGQQGQQGQGRHGGRGRGDGRRHSGGPEAVMAEQGGGDAVHPQAGEAAGMQGAVVHSGKQTGAGEGGGHLHVVLPEAFAKLGLEPAILHSLAEIHFEKPSEIQEKMIPVALTGKDILGQARTGTGKTAAFGLPIVQKIDLNVPLQALVVVPTRELAVQVEAELKRFCKHRPVRTCVVYGGTKVSGDLKHLARHPHVVVGTPGRLMDLNERGVLPLDAVRFVVCDEVDRMFDIGFRDDIRKILSFCTAGHQTIFVSATISDDIERMVARHMTDPQRIFTAGSEEQLTNPEAKQYYVGVNPWDKQRALRMLIARENPGLAIVFCRTKRSVDKVAAGLRADGINASPIHGDLMQNKRERVMRGFRTGKINVLVATDLASRGIDVHEISHVINYDIPDDPEVYVHRVGRTARMGATGKAITFVAHGEAQLQTEVEKLINHLMEEYKIDGFVARPDPHAGQQAKAAVAPTAAGAAGAEGAAGAGAAGGPGAVEGYMPTSYADVKPAAATRPISGRFPTRRKR